MPVVLNEIKQAEMILEKGEVGNKPTSTLFLLSKYYRQKLKLSEKKTSEKLNEFMNTNYKNYNPVLWENIIEDISRKGKKYELRNVESVGITQSELNRIKSAKTKNHKKIFLLADSEENLGKVEAVLSRHNRGIRVTGQMVISENEEQIQDAINAINGTETDCILSVLPSPFQERFITANKALLNVRVWLGGGCAFTGHLDEIKLRNRIRFFIQKKIFRYHVEQEKE